MISTKKLKQIAARMDDGPLKTMINQLPDQISREGLVSKMDLILPFMTKWVR